MALEELIDAYLTGANALRRAVEGMSAEALQARPIPGKWSTLEVVCHLADFEPIYADRMKRVIAENEPRLPGGDPKLFAARLGYCQRIVTEELTLVEITRRQMARILHTLNSSDFQRRGIHSEDGPLSLEQLLLRITGHIPHHLAFIAQKRQAMGI